MLTLAPRKKKPPGSQPRGDQGAGAPLAMTDHMVPPQAEGVNASRAPHG